MKSSEITDSMRRCMHREPALRPPLSTAPLARKLVRIARKESETPVAARPAPEAAHSTHDHHSTPQIPDSKPSQQARTLEKDRQGEAPGTRLPIVIFTLRRVRLLDADAKYGSIKDLLDGCQYAGLIRGDREDQISLEVRQETVGSFKEEETVIEIHNPDGKAVTP